MNHAPWFINWKLLGVTEAGDPVHLPTVINDVVACHCHLEHCQLDRALYRSRVVGFIQALESVHAGEEDLRTVLSDEEGKVETNYWAPDGYRYGVMFEDGSIADHWNGSTQRERAQEYADQTIAWLADQLGRPPRDRITLARMTSGEPWVRCEDAAQLSD